MSVKQSNWKKRRTMQRGKLSFETAKPQDTLRVFDKIYRALYEGIDLAEVARNEVEWDEKTEELKF